VADSGLRIIDGEEVINNRTTGSMHVRAHHWNATANRDTHVAWCGVVEATVVGAAPKYMVDDQDDATCRACEDSMAAVTIDGIKKKEERT
jgi:hypothetical protein